MGRRSWRGILRGLRSVAGCARKPATTRDPILEPVCLADDRQEPGTAPVEGREDRGSWRYDEFEGRAFGPLFRTAGEHPGGDDAEVRRHTNATAAVAEGVGHAVPSSEMGEPVEREADPAA